MPPLLLDPTLVYALLIVGFWLGVTATYIPGTWIPETGALVTLAGAFALLTMMPTNWISVVLLVGGMTVFVALPFANPNYTRWTNMALVVQGIGSVFLFQGMVPNLLLIALILALAFVYNQYLLLPTLEKMRALPLVGDDALHLFGAEGYIMSAVNPPAAGTAQVNGEMWTVRSSDDLQKGDSVRVVGVHGLELEVERMKPKRKPQPQADTPMTNGAVLHEEQ